jgi:NADH-quinone oxidoreductase subunit N
MLVCGAIWKRTHAYMRHATLVALLVAMGLAVLVATDSHALYGLYFSGAAKLDAITTFGRLLFGAAGVLVVLASWDVHSEENAVEFFALFVLSLLGEVVIVSGQNMLMLFLGIELLALPTYALIAIHKTRDRAIAAGLKYFLLGMFASVVMLYGIALLYGSLGTISYIHPLFPDPSTLSAARLGVLQFAFFFLILGLGFKVTAFPFHFWSPDVYAGGSTQVVAYVSTVPKVAIMLAIFRILGPSFTAGYPVAKWFLIALAVGSMVYGNVVALMQDDVRRMLAYSGVANTGYMLIAIIAGGADSQAALLFFLVVYTFGNLGAFFVVLGMGEDRHISIGDFDGLARRYPLLALAMACFLFSLAGTPPLAGFFGKFALFKSAVAHGLPALALVGLVMTVVSVGYYLKIASNMYGDLVVNDLPEGRPIERIPVALRIAIALAVAATLVVGIFGIPLFLGSL